MTGAAESATGVLAVAGVVAGVVDTLLALLVDDTGSTAADDVTGAVSFAVALSCAFATGTSAIEPATAAASESPTARFALDVAAIITSRE
ncbi:hypothetical protein HMPREF2617_06010 [Corynebacterium sp. HMSC070H05]|nr:hypothetical protein HMPREF3120_04615 [Corynebacterium sp. HMSC11D10]OHQ55523.1 hypothetical protein HMPREF2617_06010 [Corynebacterium sp. HMSC070H05]